MTTVSCAPADRQFFCPDRFQLFKAVMGLLPSGRAWQTHQDMAEIDRYSGNAEYGRYELGGSVGLGGQEVIEPQTDLQRYWFTYAVLLEFLYQRACALIEEFFCATVDENRAEWEIDYDFPGACPAWPTLCDKVAAQGGTRCEYWQAMAAAMGWSITCLDCHANQAMCMQAGCSQACGCPPDTIYVAVDASESASYADDTELVGLKCIVEQIRHAHLKVVYVLT
jgi:uncharacterized protein YmfQ (DUF2313 family)